jgi:hypothetical protein
MNNLQIPFLDQLVPGLFTPLVETSTGFHAEIALPHFFIKDRDFEAFRWTAESGMVGLGDLPDGQVLSNALGVSADGSVVVGRNVDIVGSIEGKRTPSPNSTTRHRSGASCTSLESWGGLHQIS